MKTKATIYLESAIWREFRSWCLRAGVSASEVIEDKLRDHLGLSDEKPANDSANDSSGARVASKRRTPKP